MRLLILGGTTEASRLAQALAGRADLSAMLSLAGRTAAPAASSLPVRIGGFGGVEGLARYIADEGVVAVVDATHPFAARISTHAAAACARAGVPLLAYSRPPWEPAEGDRWTTMPDIPTAIVYLTAQPRRSVFVTTGRLDLAAFRAAPQHRYLVRTIDPPQPEAVPPDTVLVQGRAPFTLADEAALMVRHEIDLVVTKNSGGTASQAKLLAARRRGIAVLMVARPAIPPRPSVDTLEAVLAWIDAHAPLR